MNDFRGTGVAMVTPMNADESVDFQGLENLVAHIGPHVDYFVVMGTTGEIATITVEEAQEVLAVVKAQNQWDKPIMYGIGGNDTNKLIKEIERTDFSDIDAVLSVSPYYNKPSQRGIIKHFTALADASPKPIVLYNVPGRTGSNLTASTSLELAQHENIIGIKEASGDIAQCMEIAYRMPDDFLLISGDDLMTPQIIAMGGVGVISVIANAYPKEFSQAVNLSLEGKNLEAVRAFGHFLEVNPHLYQEGNPVGIKVCLEEMGVCSAAVRIPHAEASDALKTAIKAHMPAWEKPQEEEAPKKPKLKEPENYEFGL